MRTEALPPVIPKRDFLAQPGHSPAEPMVGRRGSGQPCLSTPRFLSPKHKLKSAQKDKVRQFMACTQAGEGAAISCLTQSGWKLDEATNSFFQNPDVAHREPVQDVVDRRKLEQLYSRYRDPQDENKIGIDGIQQFCDDLSLDPASLSVLVIAWKFRAATQCEFSKQEFVDGMTELGCDSTDKLRALLPRLERELQDTTRFKDFYQFTFTFAKSPGQKALDVGHTLACLVCFSSHQVWNLNRAIVGSSHLHTSTATRSSTASCALASLPIVQCCLHAASFSGRVQESSV
ncbi:DCN1-like protein 2 isoform X1 [Tupaia chinensis]|uniref:DCN1-like protein 2 isoform X1 n=1 Tax=Tupaia chinensis TaxID=246437 RepID=UPI000FFC887E|nr:DCN1-like protein 2 isoform X1 [Tupaia chinensis]